VLLVQAIPVAAAAAAAVEIMSLMTYTASLLKPSAQATYQTGAAAAAATAATTEAKWWLLLFQAELTPQCLRCC
jgi:hypothetical protein